VIDVPSTTAPPQITAARYAVFHGCRCAIAFSVELLT
jgi:hypothetical protein